MLFHPTWRRTCESCIKWHYNDDTGEMSTRFGFPVLRNGSLPSCWKCPKLPRNAPQAAPQYAIEMSDKNFAAWKHYRQCRAVGIFPDDPIVRRNAEIIREIEDEKAAKPLNDFLNLIQLKVKYG